MTRAKLHLVEITGDAGLRSAPDIAETLRKALANHDSIAVATAGIISADITTIQLLLAAHRQALASGKSLSLAAPPAGALLQVLVATGVMDPSGKPQTPEFQFWTPTTPDAEGKAA